MQFKTKETEFWLAVMDDGTIITRRDYIRQAIENHSAQLLTLTWVQDEQTRYKLNFVNGFISVNGVIVPWPLRLNYEDVNLVAFKRWSADIGTSPDPSPEPSPIFLFTGIGVNVRIVGEQRVRMFMAVRPDGTWKWITDYVQEPTFINAARGVAYWKIYYKNAVIRTARQGTWEDMPSEDVQVVLLFFKEGHPAYPRARLVTHDYYWKDGNLFGFSHTDPAYTRGTVKTGSLVSNTEWRWIQMASKCDYRAHDYENPSPEWE